jgi:tetratricopeptide (TPR) repeat protein
MSIGFSRLALATAFLVAQPGGSAFAQQGATAPQLQVTPQERAAIAPLQAAVTAQDYAAATAALPAAQAAAQSADARYAVANLQFQIGRGTNNMAVILAGSEAMIASGKVPQDQLGTLYKIIGAAAQSTKDYGKADRALTRYVELAPNDADGLVALAQNRFNQNLVPDGLALVERAIGVKKAAGQAVPEQWYKVAVNRSMTAKLTPQTLKLGREWIAAYPKPESWRDVLISLRELAAPDRDLEVDIYRSMRATKSLAGERDFALYVNALSNSGYPGEAKAVLDEAVAARMIDPAKAPFGQMQKSANARAAADKPTLAAQEAKALAAATGTMAASIGNAYYGYGNYAKAIELYQAALRKGSVDTNLVNTRLGLALALAGRKPEAEAALRSVGGTRADLAGYLLIWLSQQT